MLSIIVFKICLKIIAEIEARLGGKLSSLDYAFVNYKKEDIKKNF